MQSDIIDQHEASVRSYCRNFPAIFDGAIGAWLTTRGGARYLDLLCGAGSLNYGHNPPVVTGAVIDYLSSNRIINSLDLYTEAKADFVERFSSVILANRNLPYLLQFPGPTGTNAVEAAIKIARKATKRVKIVAFTGGFHGMSLGALAASSNARARRAAGVPLGNVTFMPYRGFTGDDVEELRFLETMLLHDAEIDPPAALIVEMVQGEGGLSSLNGKWMGFLSQICDRIGCLLIIDDIQAGCGRTGSFFSFEPFGVTPDIVVLSKSLSGFGTPFSLVLLKPELDVMAPGEHNGTFRGNNLAFIGATAAIDAFWSSDAFERSIGRRGLDFRSGLREIAGRWPRFIRQVKGRGLMLGIEFCEPAHGHAVSRALFETGIIAETCGSGGSVLKFLPPLTITEAEVAIAVRGLVRACETVFVPSEMAVG